MEVLIGGDVYLGGLIENMAINSPAKIWGNSIDLFHSCDLRIINLESPLTNSNRTIKKTGPCIKASPSTVNTLTYAKINLVTLANNHILDYDLQGLEDTLDVCEGNDINHVGAARSLTEARETFYYKNDGKTIAIINFTENEWASASRSKGGAHPMDVIDNVHQIVRAKSIADFVIVIIHGGHEHYSYPSPRMVKQYRFYAEQGADVIVGHHTHTVSGYEVYNNVPIFYSIGNLIFPSATEAQYWKIGTLIKIKFGSEISFELIPYRQFDKTEGIVLLDAKEKALFHNQKIDQFNKIITSPELLEEEWDKFLEKSYKTRLLEITGQRNLFYRALKHTPYFDKLINKRKLRLLLNLFRCEAHRDLSIDTLEQLSRDI
ncbi:hypothetical protein C900_00161 [Fulvivirga imtechensis AK7]|uniref:Capsule synthesis protein CapA domain-containing protein n=1 Tax=Fulvivirga imtechensis AK7 TaxID=1237149 RepID=L8JIJ5_9BACT|nr:CapA family protein [Fulvivirga imtechensis]ELR68650.1 hypothetical protein C900_00161 [Fulvivirga imtechensis AK7]